MRESFGHPSDRGFPLLNALIVHRFDLKLLSDQSAA